MICKSRYDFLKSWPHCETQCASSIAISVKPEWEIVIKVSYKYFIRCYINHIIPIVSFQSQQISRIISVTWHIQSCHVSHSYRSITTYRIIPSHINTHHIKSHHTISYHINHIKLNQITSITSNLIKSNHIILYQINPV